VLQEQTLAGDEKRYNLGATVSFQVVQDQRDLATAQSAEVQSMANYTHAQINLDQALGTTLEVNHIATDEALGGRLSRTSVLPADLPKPALPDPALPKEERP
jgi:outer membrane protein TolC